MSSEVLVKVEGVRKKFCRSLKRSLWYGMKDMAAEVCGGGSPHERLRPGEFWAVDDVSFELRRGECLGLIGRNGAGKTTLLKMLNGLIKPDAGRIEMRGRVGALIALGAGFNPILTGRENVYVNGSVLGLTKREINEKLDEIIDFAEIRDFIDSPVQSYSSGMQVRLGFAVASSLSPDILLIDEVLAVGDLPFRDKCVSRILKIRDAGASLIFVSHNTPQTLAVCNVGAYLAAGQLVAFGSIAATCMRYLDDIECTPSASSTSKSSENASPKIVSISFTGVDEGEVRSLQPATFKMAVAVSTELSECFPAFHVIENRTSKLIASVDSMHWMGAFLTKGTHQFTCYLGNVPLVPGTYSIRAYLIHKYETILARHGETGIPYQLRVAPSSNDPNIFGRSSGAVVAVRGDWRVI